MGDVVDLRGTAEARSRAVLMGSLIERVPGEMLAEELGSAK